MVDDSLLSLQDIVKNIDAILSPFFGRGSILRPPMPPGAILDLEDIIGLKLPLDFKNALSLFDGEVRQLSSCSSVGFYFDFEALSIAEIQREYEEWNLIQAEVGGLEEVDCFPDLFLSKTGFDAGWVPFASDRGGAFLAIDLNPGERGTLGQVICFSSDPSYNIQIADSYLNFLRLILSEYRKEMYHHKFSDHSSRDYYHDFCDKHNL